MWNKWRLLLVGVSICIAILAQNTTNILDELQLIQAIGFDVGEDGGIIGTVNIVSYLMNKDYETTSLSEPANSARHHQIKMESMTSHPVHTGKLAVMLFGADLAKAGIGGTLDTYYRDPKVASRAFLSVVNGKAKNLLENKYPFQEEELGYLKRLIDHNVNQGNLPRTNIHLFLRTFYEEGKDPFLPLLTYGDRFIQIEGIALFKKDQWVDRIDLKQAFFLKLLTDEYETGGLIELPIDDTGELAVLKELKSKKSYTFHVEEENPSIDVDIQVKALLSEYTGRYLTKKELNEVKDYCEKEMEKRMKTLLHYFQEKELDPAGFGDQVMHHTSMSADKWYALYPDIQMNVNFDIKITESGVSQ